MGGAEYPPPPRRGPWWRSSWFIAAAAVFGGLIILGLIVGDTNDGTNVGTAVESAGHVDEETGADETTAAESTTTTEPPVSTTTTQPVDPMAALQDAIRDATSDDSATVSTDGESVVVAFEVSDSLTKNMIRNNLRRETSDALRAAIESDVEFTSVWVEASFPMTDQLGNTTLSQVLHGNWPRGLLVDVNWPNFDYKNITEIAPGIYVHPEFWYDD